MTASSTTDRYADTEVIAEGCPLFERIRMGWTTTIPKQAAR